MLPAVKSSSRHLRFTEESEMKTMQSPRVNGTIVSPRSNGQRRVVLEDPFPGILGTFESSLRTFEDHAKTTPSIDRFNLSKPLSSGSSYINPEISKNIQRVNLMRAKPKADDADSRPSSRTGRQKPPDATSTMDKHYIDEHYPHSATSRAINRLPLPSNAEYNIQSLIQAAKKTPPSNSYIRRIPSLSLEDTLRRETESVLNLLPHIEFEHETIREKKDSTAMSDGAKVFWTIRPVAGQKPESREGPSVCWLDRKLYLFGGQSMIKRNEVRVLNPDTWTWSILSTQYTPKGRVGHSITPFKKQIILFGGWSHYSARLQMRRCFKKLYVLYLEGESNWQRFRGEGRIPKSRRYHCMSALGSTMLVYGGVDTHSKVLSSLYALDMDTYRWMKLKPSNTPGPRSNTTLTAVFHPSLIGRYDFSLFAMPKLRIDQILPHSGFYLFGGLDAKAQPTNDLWILGLFESGLMWNKVEASGTPPIPRSDHTAVMISGYLAIFGGRNDFKAAGSLCLGDLHMLKLDTLKWEQVVIGGAIPPPRWAHCAAVLGSKMLVLGGIDYAHFLPANLFIMETESSLTSELLRVEQEKQRQDKQVLLRRLSKNIFAKF